MAIKLERLLIVRTDRIGDLILSTPVLETLHQWNPKIELSLLAQAHTGEVVSRCPYLKSVFSWTPNASRKQRRELVTTLKQKQFDAALILYVDRSVMPLLRAARIPIRVGPSSKLASYLYLTQRVRQNRSQCDKSEAEYNLDLLKPLGVPPDMYVRKTSVWSDAVDASHAQDFLAAHGIAPSDTFVLVHPGSGGSALNWPLTLYQEWIHTYLRAHPDEKVALVLGPLERGRVAGTRGFGGRFVNLEDIPNLRVYAEILKRARFFVGGSTGPLHLAHAVGTPVIGLYSPVRTHTHLRWGPYPEHQFLKKNVAPSLASKPSNALILVPDVDCPAEHTCVGPRCSFSLDGKDCMGRISVDSVLQSSQLFH